MQYGIFGDIQVISIDLFEFWLQDASWSGKDANSISKNVRQFWSETDGQFLVNL